MSLLRGCLFGVVSNTGVVRTYTEGVPVTFVAIRCIAMFYLTLSLTSWNSWPSS